MKCRYFITFFAVFFLVANARAMDFDTFSKLDDAQTTLMTKYTGLSSEKLTELTDFVDKASKAPAKPELIGQDFTPDNDCSHCPKHVKLAGDINKILDQMKKDPTVNKEEEVPISINRLKFLYYTVKSRSDDGVVSCQRYNDITTNLQPTKFDGQMDLMAENVFKFEGATAAQVLDPNKEEVVYYYRGEGEQKNIIVQAILGKDGGKFRYYYYRPTEKEKNPYGLPTMGGEAADPTTKRAQLKAPPILQTAQDKIDDKNRFRMNVDPTLETKMGIIPKNVHVAEAEVSQNVGGEDGLRVSANSHLSLRGNEANMDLQTEKGRSYVQINMLTNLKGETTRTVTVPYEVKLGADGDKDALQVKGKVVDSSTEQILNLSLTDSATTYIRTELKREKLTNVNTYAIAKDFSIDKDSMATVAVGSNEEKRKYISFQHRMAVKDNITMVLDVRMDDNHQATVMYQLKAKF